MKLHVMQVVAGCDMLCSESSVVACKFSFVAPTTEVCRSRSTGVDSGRSWCFSTGAGAEPGVDILSRTGPGAGVIFSHSAFEILIFICTQAE